MPQACGAKARGTSTPELEKLKIAPRARRASKSAPRPAGCATCSRPAGRFSCGYVTRLLWRAVPEWVKLGGHVVGLLSLDHDMCQPGRRVRPQRASESPVQMVGPLTTERRPTVPSAGISSIACMRQPSMRSRAGGKRSKAKCEGGPSAHSRRTTAASSYGPTSRPSRS
eukprot:scaffold300089_cov28-Tisochrysis_lutea.AAC.4